MTNKIGLAITTKDNTESFIKCVKSIPENTLDYICVVNDGDPYSDSVYSESKVKLDIVQHSKNLGVACAKNSALRTLIQNDCELLFIMNDNVLIKNPEVFSKYIKAAMISGLWHMNFAFSKLFNFDKDMNRVIRETIDYDEENSIIFTANLISDFQFFHKSIIKNIGYLDERYSRFNNLECFDYVQKLVKSGLLPSNHWWPDINNSWEYLTVDNLISHDNNIDSKNIQMAVSIFTHKHSINPFQIADISKEEVLNTLNKIQNTYARNNK